MSQELISDKTVLEGIVRQIKLREQLCDQAIQDTIYDLFRKLWFVTWQSAKQTASVLNLYLGFQEIITDIRKPQIQDAGK